MTGRVVAVLREWAGPDGKDTYRETVYEQREDGDRTYVLTIECREPQGNTWVAEWSQEFEKYDLEAHIRSRQPPGTFVESIGGKSRDRCCCCCRRCRR